MSGAPDMALLPADRRALVAVDLGAESCRVSLLRWVDGRASIALVHRFANAPRDVNGALHWDLGMIEAGLDGVDFVVANTDAQALAQSKAGTRIQLGAGTTEGLGAGAQPEVGRAGAEESMAEPYRSANRGSGSQGSLRALPDAAAGRNPRLLNYQTARKRERR